MLPRYRCYSTNIPPMRLFWTLWGARKFSSRYSGDVFWWDGKEWQEIR